MSAEGRGLNILVVAHGHPAFGAGGGEIAAYNLFKALQTHRDVADVAFLARTPDKGLAVGAMRKIADGEFVWRRHTEDWMTLRAEDARPLGETLRPFLQTLAPDIVFVHHYVHLGIDSLAEIRRTLPDAKLILTLHDYVAICQNAGLMAKTGIAGALCGAASPSACHACFPGISEAAFDERERDLKRHFEAIDAFVAPSRFARDRYVAWGIDAGRMAVVENGLEPECTSHLFEANRVQESTPAEGKLRLGFFGQIRDVKGLDILLGALHRLSREERAGVSLAVNGSRLEAQPLWYQELIERLRRPLIEEGTVLWNGPYARADLSARMGAVDLVVVPSTWWENSPIVIQEAFAFAKPVIGARLGGIAEKVRDGVDGLLFDPRDSRALAQCLRRVLADRALLSKLARHIRPPPTASAMADAYLDVARHSSR